MWHELIHLVHYMELWGPLPGWWAYPFERFYDYLTARVTAKTDPELSILKIVNVCSAFVICVDPSLSFSIFHLCAFIDRGVCDVLCAFHLVCCVVMCCVAFMYIVNAYVYCVIYILDVLRV
jgi:hypothetical protein